MSRICTSLSRTISIGSKRSSQCGVFQFVRTNNHRLVAFISTDSKEYEKQRRESIEARTVEFSQSRARDISGAAFELQANENGFANRSESQFNSKDDHVESYDSHGSISLYSVMQSTVPEPYSARGKKAPTHLNMPGGHAGQSQKYLSDNLQKTHSGFFKNTFGSDKGMSGTCSGSYKNLHLLVDCKNPTGLLTKMSVFFERSQLLHLCRKYSQNSDSDLKPSESDSTSRPLSAREKLKLAVKVYGSTVIVFHVTISLISLGGFYFAVSSGLDVCAILEKLGISQDLTSSKLTTGASTFVVAYAIHKVFAPARIAITLAATPFIVKYLRKTGFLKKPN